MRDLFGLALCAVLFTWGAFYLGVPTGTPQNAPRPPREATPPGMEEPKPKPGPWVGVELSVYSAGLHGSGTATGERYNHYKGHTAATTTRKGKRFVLPPGSYWEVEYKGKTVTVRINDNGPTEPRKKGAKYWLDLSGCSWKCLIGGAGGREVGRMRRVWPAKGGR